MIAREVGGETVILDLNQGTYCGLNSVGARFFQLLQEDKTVAQSVDFMLSEYEVERETLEQDLQDLTDTLVNQNLIHHRKADGENG